jgi:hypothetical protein
VDSFIARGTAARADDRIRLGVGTQLTSVSATRPSRGATTTDKRVAAIALLNEVP